MLHFSSLAAVLSYLGISILAYYACGYVFLNRIIKVKLRGRFGTFVSLPIYLAAGISILTAISYAVGILVINGIVVDLISVAVVTLFAWDVLQPVRRLANANVRIALGKLRRFNARSLVGQMEKNFPSLIAGLVFVIGIIYIASIIAVFEWPPPGDLVSHGFFTSLMIYDQRVPSTFYPLADSGLSYPLGFHVNAAFLSLLLGIYPGESVFLFGGVLMIALISLVFSLTYIMTQSVLLSITSYALTFSAYSTNLNGGDLERWLFGYLFNGPYPNIYGFLIVLLIVTMVAIYAKTQDRLILLRFYPILMMTVLLAYPNFAFFPLLLFVLVSLQVGPKSLVRGCFKTRRDTLVTVILVVAFAYFSLVAYLHVLFTIGTATFNGFIPYWYVIPQGYFSSVFGFSMIMAFILITFLLILSSTKIRRYSPPHDELKELTDLKPLLLTSIMTIAILLLTLNDEFYNLLKYIMPIRLAVMISILSFVLNVFALSQVFSMILRARKLHNLGDRRSVNLSKNVAVVLTVVLLLNTNGILVYSLSSHANLNFANYYAWFPHSSGFQDDQKALEWIQDNVSNTALILNDWSWSGLYLVSFSLKNVSMNYALMNLNRTRELQQVWIQADNRTLVYSLVKRYNVAYILTTSEWNYLDVLGDWTYKRKPNSPLGYFIIFSSSWFLEEVFRSGLSAVFRVK